MWPLREGAKKSHVWGRGECREKCHTMSTRKFEKYEVEVANTERYARSSIPYMQTLLNESN